MSGQAQLFEPTPSECAPLAMQHAKRADRSSTMADVAAARGWASIATEFRQEARDHQAEAECLAMLADFYRLAGVSE